jgi:hypothetical protein
MIRPSGPTQLLRVPAASGSTGSAEPFSLGDKSATRICGVRYEAFQLLGLPRNRFDPCRAHQKNLITADSYGAAWLGLSTIRRLCANRGPTSRSNPHSAATLASSGTASRTGRGRRIRRPRRVDASEAPKRAGLIELRAKANDLAMSSGLRSPMQSSCPHDRYCRHWACSTHRSAQAR